VHKEEGLVFLNRPSDRKAVLIPDVIRFLAGVEEVPGISCRPLAVPPAAAVESVSSLLEHHIHDGAAIVSELRRETVVLHFEFLHDLDGRFVIDARITAFSLFGRADRGSVQANFSSGVALTIGDVVCSCRIVIVYADTGGLGYSACQEHQAKYVSAVERDVANVLIGDVRAEAGALSVE